MKQLLFLSLLLIGISINAMEKELHFKRKKLQKQETEIEIEERYLCAQVFIENTDRVIIKNGFHNKHKKALFDTQRTLKATDVKKDPDFKSFVKTAKGVAVLLEEVAHEDIFLDQIFHLGQLCLYATKINIRNMKKSVSEELALQPVRHHRKHHGHHTKVAQIPMPIIMNAAPKYKQLENVSNCKNRLEEELEGDRGNESDN